MMKCAIADRNRKADTQSAKGTFHTSLVSVTRRMATGSNLRKLDCIGKRNALNLSTLKKRNTIRPPWIRCSPPMKRLNLRKD